MISGHHLLQLGKGQKGYPFPPRVALSFSEVVWSRGPGAFGRWCLLPLTLLSDPIP